MKPLSAGDVFLTVAIMSVTFLTEVGLFIVSLRRGPPCWISPIGA
jgi:hypothetical protein